MLKRTLPDWNDKKGVAKLAAEILAHHWAMDRVENPFERYGRSALGGGDGIDDEFFRFRDAEDIAVKAALGGDVAPLVDLLQGESLDWLTPETRTLMGKLMMGKCIRGRGRPKMVPEVRLAGNPMYRAATEAEVLRVHFRRFYPEQSPPKVRARAIKLAANRANVELEKLKRHLNRSKNDRRRRIG